MYSQLTGSNKDETGFVIYGLLSFLVQDGDSG